MKRLLVVTGATATGKSSLAQAVARLCNAHIVSVDALKVYKGMDIGTDKPPLNIREEIPHYMIDIVSPSEKYSVARYLEDVRPVLAMLRHSGIPFLLEGGSPLYIKALTEGIFEGVGETREIRERLEEEADRYGSPFLHTRLAKFDPEAASRIHPNDRRRVIRALEVYLATGKRISELQRQFGSVSLPRFLIVLWRGREELRRRIAERVERMFREGFVEEVENLLCEGVLGRTASQAAGYAEVKAFLEGKISLEAAKHRTMSRHWHLARRQMVWLKGFTDAVHICLRGEVDWTALAERMVARLMETTVYP